VVEQIFIHFTRFCRSIFFLNTLVYYVLVYRDITIIVVLRISRKEREQDGIFTEIVFGVHAARSAGMQISLVYPVVGSCHVREGLRPPCSSFYSCIIGSAGIVATREESREDYLSSLFLSFNKK